MRSNNRRETAGIVAAAAIIGVTAAGLAMPAAAQQDAAATAGELDEVTITARRREETAQDVPIPVSVLRGEFIDDSGAFNVNRVKELVPTVQLYSSNPRNTGVNIRGLGTTFGLTNDGIDAGVGFYVDGVFYARPASTTLDFIDVEQLEVLRGPRGTLFGKNTTAGAIVITTRKASFTPEADFELGYGSEGFIQAKGSLTGPLSERIAGRLSFSATQRDGTIENVVTGEDVNTMDNVGFRGQLLFAPSDNTEFTLAADYTRQRPNGYAQVVAGVVPTLRSPDRQFEQIIDYFGYDLPSRNPFDRVIDNDTAWLSDQNLGGVSFNADIEVGSGTLTSTTAWRFWDWGPSSDRDFTGLPVLTLSQAPSRQEQWTQEVRWAGELASKLSGVVGLFVFGQTIDSEPVHTEESGSAQWRFSYNPSVAPFELWERAGQAGVLDGYGIATTPNSEALSAAVFAEVDWAITDRLSLLPGIRFNYDQKKVDYDRVAYGGMDPADWPIEEEREQIAAIKKSIYSSQAFVADVDDTNVSGQLTLNFRATDAISTYATVSTAFKPVGINVGGIPNGADGLPDMSLVAVKPEDVRHFELGIKTEPTENSTANFTVFQTDVHDYQTQVQKLSDLGVNRGYLANAEKVRVRGAEFDGNLDLNDYVSLHTAIAWTDGKYVSYPDAPVPLEGTGAPASASIVDASGGLLPGISKWAGNVGGEVGFPVTLFNSTGELVGGFDAFYRDDFSSSPTPSEYLNVETYTLFNLRVGFRAANWAAYLWSRNLFDEEYFEQLLPAAGGAGHYAAVLGDPRTYGVSLRYSF
jgi:iron complex outermembrane receptor protein